MTKIVYFARQQFHVYRVFDCVFEETKADCRAVAISGLQGLRQRELGARESLLLGFRPLFVARK